MKTSVLVFVAGALSAFTVASATFASERSHEPLPAHAVRAKGDKAKPAGPGPTAIDKKVKLSPDGLHFGIGINELSKLYDKVLDEEYVALYKTVEPGPRMAELDSELADKKTLILRNKLEFGALPSGLDNTPLAGEFTYNNNESMTQIKLRSGITRYFFFFGDSLWKVYDVHKLGKKSRLGADYDAAVEGLTKQFGKAPRALKADANEGRNFDQADWEDKETIIRVKNQGGSAMSLAYIDRKIEENITKYRTNRGPGGEAVSKEVSDVTKSSAPPPPPAPKGKK